MREISISCKERIASQIKGEKQLSDLTNSVPLTSGKFDEFEKDRKTEGELITKLQTKLEQYSK